MSKKQENRLAIHKFLNPVIDSLKELNCRATAKEIEKKAVENMGLSEEEISLTDRRGRSKAFYNIRWAFTCLKRKGILESGGRPIWILKNKDQKNIEDPKEFLKESKKIIQEIDSEYGEEDISPKDLEEDLSEKLLEKLKNIEPYAFEKLCRDLLQKIGLRDVEVTPPTKDGGIDGLGILKINDLLSFHIAFQCKRHQGVVRSQDIRNFRGSMKSGIDRGIILTTGEFSTDAQKEAVDLGKQTIDLIDGELLIEKIKETQLGVKVEQVVNIISIDDGYFESLEK